MVPFVAALALLLTGCASTRDSGAAIANPVVHSPATTSGVQTATAMGPAQAEDAPCGRDEDCAFTRVAEGACCPMLCTPRVVTKKRAAELDANLRVCTNAKPESCPRPACRERSASIAPACDAGRCIARTVTPRGD